MAKLSKNLLHHLGMGDLSVPTYTAGLLQAQAYRALKQHLSDQLKGHSLTMPDWALLGLLNDHGRLRLSALAELMHVEASLSTTLVNKLQKQGLVERQADPNDNRAKYVLLTTTGQQVVDTVERQLRQSMREFTSGISAAELVVYVNVLAKLASKATEADED